ncbi:hypothetical protein BS47DRAFT_1350446 [Hydnum rufescens UP504]|uniref:Uncharacterized protein n=1 Tax=Hydnum rufescens UP504 TaxID=1448309 RepID=A0A9P6AMR2_9AGAM|nr:hypothetical protein BS47DRAFT_1352944 [Hydnum rufescens UP504]KAF9508397.1 hypothetical protein BS47DRAFT_1350446 [Hydnum rufescens UP504]
MRDDPYYLVDDPPPPTPQDDEVDSTPIVRLDDMPSGVLCAPFPIWRAVN